MSAEADSLLRHWKSDLFAARGLASEGGLGSRPKRAFSRKLASTELRRILLSALKKRRKLHSKHGNHFSPQST